MNQFHFPFGQPLKKVEQKDQTPKKVFVLGVYASAVHARWVDMNGKQKVAALAVASEPEIFWRGENVQEIINCIQIPVALGRLLVPANKSMNGPSGRALDDLFLSPLGYSRKDVWLSDLLPESRVNEKQKEAITNHYTPEIVKQFNLTPATIPDFNKSELDSAKRSREILKELETSQASTIILLGDLPIKWFLRFYSNKDHSKLSDFGETSETYGSPVDVIINNKKYKIIALCHPRQAGRLGTSSLKWGQLHTEWIRKKRV